MTPFVRLGLSAVIGVASALLSADQVFATLTRASAQAEGVGETHQDSPTFKESANAKSGTGSASANVDLAQGSIRVFVQGPGLRIQDGIGVSTEASAYGQLRETVTVLGDINGSVSGSVVFHLSGSLTPSSTEASGYVTAFSASQFSVSFNSNGLGQFNDANTFSYDTSTQECGQANTAIFVCEQSLSTHKTFELPFSVTAERRDIDIFMQVQAVAKDFAVANFANTGFITLNLPEGNTFSSASGVFLTSPIPEPRTEQILIVGVAALGTLLATRRRGTRSSSPA